MNAGRRFSQAISEGDGISLIARVSAADDAARVEEQGAEAVLVASGDGALGQIRSATSLPVLLAWPRDLGRPPPEEADACLLDVGEDLDTLADLSRELGETCELAFRIDDEEQLESALEELDPEIFLLSPEDEDEDPLEQVLDLLPDVPAGKLAIAEVQIRSRGDVDALERAGVDAVIVERADVSRLVGEAPPEV